MKSNPQEELEKAIKDFLAVGGDPNFIIMGKKDADRSWKEAEKAAYTAGRRDGIEVGRQLVDHILKKLEKEDSK